MASQINIGSYKPVIMYLSPRSKFFRHFRALCQLTASSASLTMMFMLNFDPGCGNGCSGELENYKESSDRRATIQLIICLLIPFLLLLLIYIFAIVKTAN